MSDITLNHLSEKFEVIIELMGDKKFNILCQTQSCIHYYVDDILQRGGNINLL